MKCKRLHRCAKCVGAQFLGGELSAWYIERYKRKCNLHTFAYGTLFFYVILLGN